MKKTIICIFNFYFRGIKNQNIKQIWNKYDDDHSGKLEIAEFIEFLKEIRINIGKKINAEELFRKVDQDKSGKIDFNEFVNYYDELTSAKEFNIVFEKYSGEKRFIDVMDLIKFLYEVQNENYKLDEAIRHILNYNKDSCLKSRRKIEAILEKYNK